MKKLRRILKRRNNYIDITLIKALEACSDNPPIKLIEHCNSLNNSYKKQNYTTVAILLRGVLDYIPTIFGFANTAQVYSGPNGTRTFKKALKELDQTNRHLADDALHTPARRDETLKASQITADSLLGNLNIVLAETVQQLRTNDLRDEGNNKLIEKNAVKPKRQKSQLDNFENYIVNGNWTQQEIDGTTVWICEEDNLYQIHERRSYDEFSEPWTRVYPDKNGSGKYDVDLVYAGTTVKRLMFVYCDGGRINVVLPETFIPEKYKLPTRIIGDGEYREFYWEKNSLKYKLMSLIGSFDTYQTPEGVAKRSDITIK
ncbi:MAG: hypothetical protein QG549_592 [Patescibacteria group bacterium]|nr:hypothetical protein [Patescibacteria group bacterium]